MIISAPTSHLTPFDLFVAIAGSGGALKFLAMVDRWYRRKKLTAVSDADVFRKESVEFRQELVIKVASLEKQVSVLVAQAEEYRAKYWTIVEENAKLSVRVIQMEGDAQVAKRKYEQLQGEAADQKLSYDHLRDEFEAFKAEHSGPNR